MPINLSFKVSRKTWFSKFRESKKVKSLVVLLILSAGISPLVADQLNGTSSGDQTIDTATVTSSVAPSPTLSASPTAEASPAESAKPSQSDLSSANVSPYPSQTFTASASASAAPSPTKTPPFALSNQNMMIQMPRVVRVDPRAKQAVLPAVNFSATGGTYLMLCINSNGGVIDIGQKGVEDFLSGPGIFITGDRSQSAQMSGTSIQILNIFNSFGGLIVNGPSGKGVVGQNLAFRFVAISEPTNNFALCSKSSGNSQWSLEIQPLGIQLDTKKNTLSLGTKK